MVLDGTFKALADPTRRRILELLRDGDRTAGEIAAEFPIAWASVSHHLAVLKGAGLVRAEREGQFIRYSLDTTAFQDVVRLVSNLVGRNRNGGRRVERR